MSPRTFAFLNSTFIYMNIATLGLGVLLMCLVYDNEDLCDHGTLKMCTFLKGNR
jgi:hypothetical protein